MVRVAAVLILTLIAFAGCSGNALSSDRVQEPFHQTASATGIRLVSVDNTAGRIRISASSVSQIRIDAVKRGPDEASVSRIHIDVSKNGDTLAISTRYDSGGFSRGNVNYTIELPASMAIQVSNTAGTTTITGASGDVAVSTQAGTVDVTMARVSGSQNVDLSATTGTVTLRVPNGADATVSARSTVGAFSSDFPSVTSTREHVVGVSAGGKLGSGSARITLETTTGSIDLRR